jgi:hypothetical protein
LNLADKRVCIVRIPRIAGKFNGRADFGRWLVVEMAFPGSRDPTTPVAQGGSDVLLAETSVKASHAEAGIF